MKNNLFKKFLALFLTGTMLGAVGCKDYDDDIDSINKRLEGMDVTVADLQTQIKNVKDAIPSLDELNKNVATLTKDLTGVKTDISDINKKISDIGDIGKKLSDLTTDLKAYADAGITKSEETLKKELATKEEVKTLSGALTSLETAVNNSISALETRLGNLDAAEIGEIAKIKEELKTLNSFKTGIDNTIQSKIEELLKTDAWLGSDLNPAIEKYLLTKEYALISEIPSTDDVALGLMDKMKDAEDTYTKALYTLVGETKFKDSDLSTIINDYLDTVKPLVDALKERVGALESRIQSLVFVPSTVGEATTNTIVFEASSWIKDNDEKLHYLGGVGAQTATITYRVAPASKAQAIADAWAAYAAAADKTGLTAPVSFVEERVTRAAAADVFTITDVKAGEDGKFTVSVSTTYKFGAEENSAKQEVTPAIALHIQLEGATTGEGDTKTTAQGIDYTSAFIVTGYENTSAGAPKEINADLVFAKGDKDASPKTFGSTIEIASELEYSNTAIQKYLDGYGVYYKDSDNKLHALDSKWSELTYEIVAPVLPETPDAKPYESTDIASGDLAKLAFELTSVKINTPATALITKNVKSRNFTVNAIVTIDGATTKIKLGEANHKMTITGSTTEVATAAAEVAWNKAGSEATKFAPEVTIPAGEITSETYTKLAACSYQASLADNKYNVTVQKKGTDGEYADDSEIKVDGETFKLASDSQKATITLQTTSNAAPTKSADYRIIAKYQLENGIFVNLTTEVAFTGAPTFVEQALAGEITFTNGANSHVYEDVITKVGETIWTANETALKAAGYEKAAFVAAIADNGTFTAGDADEFGTNLAKKNETSEGILNVVLGSSLTKMPESYAFTGKFTVGQLEFPVKASIAVKAPAVTMSASGSMQNGVVPYGATIGSSSYPENAINLTGAYYLSGEAKAKVAIVYSIGEDLSKFTETKPSISDNALTWNKWNSLDMKIKAQMALVDNKAITFGAAQEYTANIADPIKGDIALSTEGKKKTTLYYNTAAQELDLAGIVTLKTIADVEVFDKDQEKDLATAVTAAIGGEADFVVTGYNEDEGVIKANKSVITVSETETVYSTTTTLKVTVKYKNQFKTYKDFSFDVLVKPASEKK